MKRAYKIMVLVLLLIILVVSVRNSVLLQELSHGTLKDGFYTENLDYSQGMYSWEDAPYGKDSKAELYATLERLKINELYQYIHDEDLYSDDVKNLADDMHDRDIDLYHLTGDPQWAMDPTGLKMRDVIDKVAAFNRAAGESGFTGIVFDVEPYGDKEAWEKDQQAVMDTYLPAMTTAYKYAKEKGLRIVICIPNWYDLQHKDVLESLISDACDEVAVMNYNRREEIVSVENEVAFAQKYNKTLSCIFEFQEPGYHELTENETYYNLGLEVAKQNFEVLRSHFGYEQINYAYHYYQPILTLLKK